MLLQDCHPIGHYSRKLCDAETRYTPTELECLSVIDSIKYFRIYLEGTNFKVVTDHSALQWLLNFQNTKRRLFHWSEHHSLFTFDVIHRPGKEMKHVDALSRAPVALIISTHQILEAQRQSTYTYTSRDISTSPDELIEMNTHGRRRLVVPMNFKPTIIKECHDKSGHPGIQKSQQQICANYWWLKMRSDIKRFVRSCHACQLVERDSLQTTSPPIGEAPKIAEERSDAFKLKKKEV